MNFLLNGSSRAALLMSLVALGACAGAPPAPSAMAIAPEGVWTALNRPRPEPLEDAARVSVSEIVVLTAAWDGVDRVDASLGLQELIAAGLLRRRDIHYVERRRFAAAVDRERRELPSPRNAPAAGTSAGAEYVLTGAWAPSGDSATLALRLVDAESGAVRAAWRTATQRDGDAASVARHAVESLLLELRALGRLPAWSDPLGGTPSRSYTPSDVSPAAVQAFFAGLASEERFDWEGARRGYQAAHELSPSFIEADVALARVARLRAGGTLGGSDPDR